MPYLCIYPEGRSWKIQRADGTGVLHHAPAGDQEKARGMDPTCVQIAPYDDEGWNRLHDLGFAGVQPDIEVWDKKLFEWICPGKSKFIGYDEWIKRTIRAVDFWVPDRSIPILSSAWKWPTAWVHNHQRGGEIDGERMGFSHEPRGAARFNMWARVAGAAFHDQKRLTSNILSRSRRRTRSCGGSIISTLLSLRARHVTPGRLIAYGILNTITARSSVEKESGREEELRPRTHGGSPWEKAARML